jgi:trigger factor
MASSDKSEPDKALDLDEPLDLVEEESDDSVSLDSELESQDTEAEDKLDLQIDVAEKSACERHITVTVSRDDIDRYFEKEYSELMPTAQVPGFRPGHAPRRLVETRFRKDVAEKVKSELLMTSIAQVNDEENLSAISEPDLDVEAVELPEEGPFTFEFDLEVRPEFDLPQWKGLRIDRPVRDFSDADVEAALKNALAGRGQLIPYDGPAAVGDYISTDLTFKYGEQVLSSAEEEVIRLRPVLSFRDGRIERFDQALAGVRSGETREVEAVLSDDAPNVALRGATVKAQFKVQEVKKLQLPDMTPEFLRELGDFDSEADLRDAIRDNLERQLVYQQHRRAREQVTQALTVSAQWDLPPHLLQRQSQRELDRAVMELRRSGFSDDEIRAYSNELRQNSMASTARLLKEHFILERIAEDEEIEDAPEDYDQEIRLIAYQSGESPRRIRARLEKSGGIDALRNQIIERKVVDLILSHATFNDVPYEPEAILGTEAIDRAAGGGDEPTIPEAKPEHAPPAATAETEAESTESEDPSQAMEAAPESES